MESPRSDGLQRREFLLASLAVAEASGAAARGPSDPSAGAADPLPPGVVARYGDPRFRGPAAISLLRFTPDSRYLVAVGRDPDGPTDRFMAWDAPSGRLAAAVVLPNAGLAAAGARCLCFPSAGQVVIGRADGERVRVDRVHLPAARLAGGGTFELPNWDASTELTLSPDGRTVVHVPGWRARKREVVAYALPEDAAELRPSGEPKRLWTLRPEGPNAWFGRAVFTPNGRAVALGCEKQLLVLCPRTGKVLRELDRTGHRHAEFNAEPVAIDAAGRVVYDSPAGGTIRYLHVWNPATGGAFHLHGANLNSPALLSAEGVLAVREGPGSGTLAVWDSESGRRVRDLPLPGYPFPDAASADGRFLAGAFGGSVAVWDGRTGEPVAACPGPIGDFRDLQYLAGDRLTARVARNTGWGGGRTTWHTRTGRPVAVSGAFPANALLDAASDGRAAVAIRDGNRAELRDESGAVRSTLSNRDGRPAPVPNRARFTADGKSLVAVDRALRVWDVATGRGRELVVPDEPGFAPESGGVLAVAANGRVAVALACRDEPARGSRVAVVDPATGAKVAAFATAGTVTELVVTPGAARVGVVSHYELADPSGRVRRPEAATVFDAATGAALCHVPLRSDRLWDGPAVVALSADGRTLVTAAGSTAVAWEVATGKERTRLPHRGEVTGAAVRADAAVVAVASRDAPVWEWEFFGTPTPGGGLAEPDRVWDDLGSPDAAVGFRAVRSLVRASNRAARLLARLAPAAPPDANAVAALVLQLGADSFRAREDAERRLGELDGAGLGLLREEHAAATDPERRERLGRVVARVAASRPATADGLRAVRAVEVAELLAGATADTKGLLEGWAGGATGSRLTREAAAALVRLKGKRGEATS